MVQHLLSDGFDDWMDPMGVATTTKVYEWPDGTFLELDFNEDGDVSYFFNFCGGGELLIRRAGNRHVYLGSVNDFLTQGDISKLLGFALDIGATIRPPLWAKESDGFDRLQMPRYVSDEEWEKRYDLPNVESGPFQPAIQVSNWMGITVLRMIQHEGTFKAVWASAWMSKTKEAQAIWPIDRKALSWQISAANAEDAKRKVVDHILETEKILPVSRKENWESSNIQKGRFLVPTPEEVEVFRLLDLPLPFFFFDSELREWIESRTA